MNGKDQEKLFNALLVAFPDVSSLRRMVRFGLDQNLDAIANTSTLSSAVFELLRWAESTDEIVQLVLAARNSNPNNTALRTVAEDLQLAPASGELESIVIGSVGFSDVETWRQKMSRCELTVCRVEMPSGANLRSGTGFLIRPDVVITNYHVVKYAIAGTFNAKDLLLRFDYKMDMSGKTAQAGQEFKPAVDWLIHSSPEQELDYALIRVTGKPGEMNIAGQSDAPTRGWLTPHPHVFTTGEPLLVIQHPNGKPLVISAGAFVRPKSPPQRIVHTVSTLGGSSGSPCFTSDWKLVALHNGGSTKGNEAVPFSAILSELTSKKILL